MRQASEAKSMQRKSFKTSIILLLCKSYCFFVVVVRRVCGCSIHSAYASIFAHLSLYARHIYNPAEKCLNNSGDTRLDESIRLVAMNASEKRKIIRNKATVKRNGTKVELKTRFQQVTSKMKNDKQLAYNKKKLQQPIGAHCFLISFLLVYRNNLLVFDVFTVLPSKRY